MKLINFEELKLNAKFINAKVYLCSLWREISSEWATLDGNVNSKWWIFGLEW